MKLPSLSILLFAFAVAIGGCSSATPTLSSEPLTVQDRSGLLAALESAGAKMETGDSITQEFFTPEGQTLKVNGADLQVFEYENAEAMEKEASQVVPDGGSIGTSMVTWIDTPHFYKTGRIIVLYLGNDQTVLDLLNKVMGPQFAGQ
jgi:hypothetical protein